jgi:hypothetical protein
MGVSGQGSQDSVESLVEAFADVFGEEPQHQPPVLLKQRILPPVATVGVRVGQVLTAVQFDREAGFRTEQIHFHDAPPIEGDRKLNAEPELPGGFRESLKPAIQECLGRAARACDSAPTQ